MQLSLSFIVLLASLFAISSVTEQADARPLKRAQKAGVITLPLKRVAQRSDIHPQVYLQQHINRSHRRLARMTGRAQPDKRELESALHKRVSSIEARGFRVGRPMASSNTAALTANAAAAPPSSGSAIGDIIAAITGGGKKKGKGKAKGAAAGAGAGAAAGAATGAATGAAAGGANSSSTANSTATGSSTGGIDPVDVAAATNGGLTAANAPTTKNSLGLDIEANDVGYIATVQMGTPPRDFKLLMDSGSADLWVGAEGCQTADATTGQTSGDCGNHTFLGTQSSSSFTDTKQQFQVTYGSGAVAGDIVTDNLNVGGLALNAHTFGVALLETDDFSSDSTDFDGLMGLAQSTLSEQKTLTPVESLAKAGLITDAITSYKISRLADQKNDGEITFGALDDTKFDAATLTELKNVNTDGFWEANLDAISVGGQDAGLTGRTAILDTGTTLIIAPPNDAQTVMSAIPGAKSDGQGGFTIPCTSNTTISMTFGGQQFDIDPRDLAFVPVDPTDLTGDCVAGISSGQVGGADEWLVGDVFLKNAYFSTDVTKNTLSLAKLV
ncbi:aspartic peptidase domain-containing protein [Amylostereum chailletii]|nr:aspartic peptidase domain-containing protein [Amylostereum chailletii]